MGTKYFYYRYHIIFTLYNDIHHIQIKQFWLYSHTIYQCKLYSCIVIIYHSIRTEIYSTKHVSVYGTQMHICCLSTESASLSRWLQLHINHFNKQTSLWYTRMYFPSVDPIRPGIFFSYRKVSNIRRTKFQNLNDSRPVLQLSLPNLLKPCIKSRMKM